MLYTSNIDALGRMILIMYLGADRYRVEVLSDRVEKSINIKGLAEAIELYDSFHSDAIHVALMSLGEI